MEDYGKHGDHVGLLGTEAVKSGASLRWPLEQSRLTTSEIILCFRSIATVRSSGPMPAVAWRGREACLMVITQDFLQF